MDINSDKALMISREISHLLQHRTEVDVFHIDLRRKPQRQRRKICQALDARVHQALCHLLRLAGRHADKRELDFLTLNYPLHLIGVIAVTAMHNTAVLGRVGIKRGDDCKV